MNSSNANWHNRFFQIAEQVATWSKDQSTQVGAVIVKDRQILSTGYNGFPRGIDDSIQSRHQRPVKYMYTEHAERNAIFNAVYNNVDIKGSTLYTTLFPCVDCCRAIIQTGIKEIVAIEPFDVSDQWKQSFEISLEMFTEAGILVEYLELTHLQP
jgi:dCMP deaminase